MTRGNATSGQDGTKLSQQAKLAPRLQRRADFLRAAARGRKAVAHGLVLQVLRRDDDGPLRVGFTVTKKVGNAVVRNRTKRRLREAARLELAGQGLQGQALAGIDLVLIGRDHTRARPFQALRDDLRSALARAGLARAGLARADLARADLARADLARAGVKR